jgi:hypothetical protein
VYEGTRYGVLTSRLDLGSHAIAPQQPRNVLPEVFWVLLKHIITILVVHDDDEKLSSSGLEMRRRSCKNQ